jgi:hypothetical protein
MILFTADGKSANCRKQAIALVEKLSGRSTSEIAILRQQRYPACHLSAGAVHHEYWPKEIAG